MYEHLNFQDIVAAQSHCLQGEGFTERQARFLTTVVAHSGVFVGRQYCRFAGVAHGQKSHDFIHRLVTKGLARDERPGRLHHGRYFHVHHKRLYSLIGQADNRHRRRAPRSRMVERLMLLDAVLDDRDMVWLGTEADKTRYFLTRLAEYRFRPHELPHLAFGSGARQTLRLFPDKLPIGIHALEDRYVFTYLVTRASTADFRTFLVRHHHLWRISIAGPCACWCRGLFPRPHRPIGTRSRSSCASRWACLMGRIWSRCSSSGSGRNRSRGSPLTPGPARRPTGIGGPGSRRSRKPGGRTWRMRWPPSTATAWTISSCAGRLPSSSCR